MGERCGFIVVAARNDDESKTLGEAVVNMTVMRQALERVHCRCTAFGGETGRVEVANIFP